MSFKEFSISQEIVRALEKLGFQTPTEIQQKAIPVLNEGKQDFIGLAQTGTGKTAAFGLPLLSQIQLTNKYTQALILCPTRELCLQITKELKNFSVYMQGMVITPVYGGVSPVRQVSELRRGTHIVVATPGRALDLIKQGALKLDRLSFVVLDEADEMLNMGFLPDLTSIMSFVPSERKTWLFSATMPKEVELIAKKFMHDPIKITVGSRNSSAHTIEHQYVVIRRRDAYEALKRFVVAEQNVFGIVFCKTRRHTKEIAESLKADGYRADALHGDLSQAQRDQVMNDFRKKKIDILVATDVAARGIDVNNVTHVFHYGLPEDIEQYTHRSGRTGRAGNTGISIALVEPEDVYRIRWIEKQIQRELTAIQVPDANVLTSIELKRMVDRFEHIKPIDLSSQQAADAIAALSAYSKEDIIIRMVSDAIKNVCPSFGKDLNVTVDASRQNRFSGAARRPDRRRRMSQGRSSSQDSASRGKRVYVTLGTKDGMGRKDVVDYIASHSSVNQRDIRQIDVKYTYSYITVDNASVARNIISVLQQNVVNGRRVRAEIAR